MHESPQQVLFPGLGTGATAWSAARAPWPQVMAVELLPEVIDVSQHFAQRLPEAEAVARLRVASCVRPRCVTT
jgi:spermidine synthase